MQKLYFTPDELARRWSLSTDDVCRLGAEGILQFGLYIDEAISLEFGRHEPPDYAFKVEDSGIFSPGFYPITARAVLQIMSRHWIDLDEMLNIFPDTDSGLSVRVKSWMLWGQDAPGEHKGVPLLVAAEEVERYEAGRDFTPMAFTAPKAPAASIIDIPGYDCPPELAVMLGAINQFWVNADPARPPKKDEEIIPWIRERVDSDSRAGAIDLLIRPEWARAGGNKKKAKG